ncbi:MAG: right-handed parallel beta-helix repeat-containing protein [Euryarchaeota archaeon]|nr:right-handed parallel beta-helix repeat-containing protein [Euryarchaeota archaeon]
MNYHTKKLYVRIARAMAVLLVVSCIRFPIDHLEAQAAEPSIPIRSYTPHAPIWINSSADFTSTNGVYSGNGNPDNPWVIENLFINSTGYEYGIYIRFTSDHFIIRNCYLSNNYTGTQFMISPSDGYYWTAGISLTHVSNATIQNNLIERNHGNGIYIGVANNIRIENNSIKNNLMGIYVSVSTGIMIADNNFSGNQSEDVLIGQSKNITFKRNIFTSGFNFEMGRLDEFTDFNIDSSNIINGKPIYYLKNQIGGVVPNDAGQVILANCSEFIIENLNLNPTKTRGIILGFSNNNTIRNNILSGFNTAISILGSSSNFIYNNTIKDCYFGIIIAGSNNTLYHNSFINNTNQISCAGTNVWDNGYPSGGNYWSDYAGNDSNNDGIGDTPYNVSYQNVDRYPLMKPYNESNVQPPSNQIYIWATIIAIIVIVSIIGLAYWRMRRRK